MSRTVMPNNKYRSRLRQVVRLLGREEVGAACELLEELKEDAKQFRIFAKSPAFRPFCNAVNASGRWFRACIEDYEAKLVVLGYIQADLRLRSPKKAKRAKVGAAHAVKPPLRRTRGRRR
jgi:hypothetical protein